MKKGIYTKACAFLGAVRWQGASGHSEEVALVLTTIAYALCEKDLVAMEAIHNRVDDVAWSRRKIAWLWEASQASGSLPQITVRQ